jgi:hypothetical protein
MEKMCERSMIKTREGMKKQLEDMNAARLKEIHEARNKISALGRSATLAHSRGTLMFEMPSLAD